MKRRASGRRETAEGPAPAPALLRELTWEQAEEEQAAYARSLSPAERVRLVAELTRVAWEGVGRERERFCRDCSRAGRSPRGRARFHPRPATRPIRILHRHRVRFLLIGGYAMAHHGLTRATEDVDVLIATDEPNRARVRRAAMEFVGVAPSDDALTPPRGMFRIGPPSAHVDVTTKVDGIADFDRVWSRRARGEFFGVPVAYLSLADMLRTKRAAGRPKDLGDIAWLESELRRRGRKR